MCTNSMILEQDDENKEEQGDGIDEHDVTWRTTTITLTITALSLFG